MCNIVSIASFWSKLLSKNYIKEQALMKMLKLGRNKFNVFVLHKFLSIVKEEK